MCSGIFWFGGFFIFQMHLDQVKEEHIALREGGGEVSDGPYFGREFIA